MARFRWLRVAWFGLVVCVVFSLALSSAGGVAPAGGPVGRGTRGASRAPLRFGASARVRRPRGELPARSSASLLWAENVGQFDPHVRFQARGARGTVWLAQDALWLSIMAAPPPGALHTSQAPNVFNPREPQAAPSIARPAVQLKLSFVGANPQARLEPFAPSATHVSYFRGRDPAGWRVDVPVWGGVRYVDLYPGIDLELSAVGQDWQPRLIARAGADLRAVRLRIDGADAVSLDGSWVRLTTAVGQVALPLLPLAGPDGQPLRRAPRGLGVQASLAANVVTAPFASGPATAAAADAPGSLTFGTYLGGSDVECAYGRCAIAVDASGAAYVAGWTTSSDFPTTPGAFDTSHHAYYDTFITKLAPDGSALVYSTYLGGNGDEYNGGLVVDASGAVYVSGSSTSSDFPTTPGAYREHGPGDYATKLNPQGTALEYSTFLAEYGGSDIAVGADGSAYVTGINYLQGNAQITVASLNATGTELKYGYTFGGEHEDYAYAIAVDANGNAYVTGATFSFDFPVTDGVFQPFCWSCPDVPDGFITKVNAMGDGLEYSTYLGGGFYEYALDLALDNTGQAYLTGWTTSEDFPTTPGAYQPTYVGGGDTFITKLSADASTLVYSTYLGSNDYFDPGFSIAVSHGGEAVVTGGTYSTFFPTTADAFDRTFNGYPTDAYVAQLSADGSTLVYSSYLGGNYADCFDVSGGTCSIALDGLGNAYLAGWTTSTTFPTTPGAFDTSFNGCSWCGDAYVAKLPLPITVVLSQVYLPQLVYGGP